MNYKTSKYNIFRAIVRKDETIVLGYNTRSTKVVTLNQKAFDDLNNGNIEKFNQCDLDELVKTGFVVDATANELDFTLQENNSSLEQEEKFYLIVQPSSYCQFGCHYCGQNTKQSAQQNTFLSEENLLRFVKEQTANKTYKYFVVGWFGGEPLTGLKQLRTLSKSLQDYAKNCEMKYSAKMVTNGFLLTEKIAEDLVVNHCVSGFEITLDGDKIFHDKRRRLKNGHPTFDRIIKNICSLNKANLRAKITLRCNVDNSNAPGIDGLLHRLADLGLQDLSVYFAPIHSWGNDANILAADSKNFATWEIEWFLLMKDLGFKVSPLPGRKKRVCMAVEKTSHFVDPYGELFGCTEHSLIPGYEKNGRNIFGCGSIDGPSENRYNYLKKRQFLDFNEKINKKEYPCVSCEMLPICGGSCPKQWSEEHYCCPSFKDNIGERLILHYLFSSSDKMPLS